MVDIRTLLLYVVGLLASVVIAGLCFALYRSSKGPLRSSVNPPSVILADASGGYVNRPNLSVNYPFGVGQSYAIRTDALGLRRPMGEPRGIVPPAGAMLFLGDSQTFGVGIEHEDTFSARLQHRLGVPALNAGVSGYGTVSILRMAIRHAPLRPRLMVVVHFAGHITRAANPCYPGFLFRCLQVPHVAIENGVARIREPDARHNQAALDEYGEYTRYIVGAAGGWNVFSDAKWRMKYDYANSTAGSARIFQRRVPEVAEKAIIAQHVYRALKDVADSVQAPLLVAYLPDYFSSPMPPMPNYLRSALAELGIPAIDLHADVVEAQRGDPERIKVPNEGHLNAVGHEMIAARLAPAIKAILEANPVSAQK